MRRIVAVALFVMASFLLSGCGTWLDLSRYLTQPEPIETVAVPAQQTGDISDGYTLEPASGRPVIDHEKRRRQVRAPPPKGVNVPNTIREALPDEPVTDSAPMKLVGLNIGETRELFGPPDTAQDGQPSRVWQYAGADCDLRLHFYFDLKAQRYRLLFYEARLQSGAQIVAQARDDVPAYCLRTLRERAVANGRS